MLEDLRAIVGERHLRSSPGHHAAVAAFIRARFEAMGWEVVEQAVRGPFGVGANLIARYPGADPRRRCWIVGAHYDTVEGTPGADDNGVAVAGLLELARRLADREGRDAIELVAWDMEEEQRRLRGLLGSRVMSRALRADRREIGGVVAMEMIGLCRREPGTQRFPRGFGRLFPEAVREVERREGRGDFLAAVGSRKAQGLLDALSSAAAARGFPLIPLVVKGPARLLPDLHRSDHAPFWWRGYPAVMLTDTANFRSGHYHQPTDTIERLDLAFAGGAIDTLHDALVELAGIASARSPA
jgi:Zn-dependent M28 family amino/carboxypeptidase